MARYNLNTNEASILTSWLFELDGYLDSAVSTGAISARQALASEPTLDVTEWIRTHFKADGVDQETWNETAMIWWMRKNDGVNVNRPQLPAETAQWITKLQQWRQSIDDAFVRVPQQSRDANTVPITAENGTIIQRPAGLQLIQQRSMFDKVLAVLQQ